MVNQNLLIEDLKRIGFMMNYEPGRLVSENKETNKNVIVESKIENLFLPKKSNEVISETTLKKIFKEQWQLKKEEKKRIIAEQWARDKDPVGYWKILYEQLKKGGVPVKLEVANDPAKSNFMYWGMWIIWKDINKNNGWPVTLSAPEKGKAAFFFKFSGGKYAGQNAGTIKLESKQINSTFELTEWGKISSEGAYNQLAKLAQTKPKAQGNVLPCKTTDGKPIPDNQIQSTADQIFKEIAYAFDGAGTYEDEAVAAYAKITCKPLLDKVNAKVAARGMSGIKNVQDWLTDEMSDYDYDQYRAIWASLQKVDKSIVAPKVDNFYRAAGVVGTAVGATALEKGAEGAKKFLDKLMNMSIEDVMEGFRGIVSGVAGTVGTLILSLIPGGQAINVLIYGVLTGWDIYQWSQKGPTGEIIFNTLIDIFSLVLSGIGMSNAMKPVQEAKAVASTQKTIPAMFAAIEKNFPKIYSLIKGFINTVGKAGKAVVDGIIKGVDWIVKYLPFLSKIGGLIKSGLGKVSGLIGQFIAGLEKKVATVVGKNTYATAQLVIGINSKALLAKGTQYLSNFGKQIASGIIRGLEGKIAAEVAKELDKQALKKIEAYAFENGTKTIEQLRPGVCAMGKGYCDTFDIAMNAVAVGKSGYDLYKAGKGTKDKVTDISTAKNKVQTASKSVEAVKSGTETIQKGTEVGTAAAPKLQDTGTKLVANLPQQNNQPIDIQYRPDPGKV